MIIALGESIVATGTGLDETGLTAGVVAAAIAGLVIAGCAVVGLLRRRRPGRRPPLRLARPARAQPGRARLLRRPAPAADRRRRARRPRAEEGAAPRRRAARNGARGRALRRRRALPRSGTCVIRLRNIGTLNRQRLFAAVILLAPDPVRDLGRRARRRARGRDRPRCPDRLRDDALPRRPRPGPPPRGRLGDDGPAGRRRIDSADADARVLRPAPRPRPGGAPGRARRRRRRRRSAPAISPRSTRASTETIDALAAIEAPTVLVPGNNETEDALREAAAGWAAATVLHGEATEIDGVDLLRPRRRGPGDALGLELRPRRGGGRRALWPAARTARCSSSTRLRSGTSTVERRRPPRQHRDLEAIEAEAPAPRGLRPHPRELGQPQSADRPRRRVANLGPGREAWFERLAPLVRRGAARALDGYQEPPNSRSRAEHAPARIVDVAVERPARVGHCRNRRRARLSSLRSFTPLPATSSPSATAAARHRAGVVAVAVEPRRR